MNNISVNKSEWMLEQKYRPTNVAETILPLADKEVFEGIIKSGRIPNMILVSQSPGTGKTTIAKALCNDLDAEVLFVNGADMKIDMIRNEFTRFASSMSLDGKHKVIIIDEGDRKALIDAQRHLRSFIEAYSNNCSFIITANNIDGIIPALQSRCRVIQFGNPTDADKLSMMKTMIVRCNEICKMEGIIVEDHKALAALVKQNFPDFRKTITMLDRYAKSGKVDAGILTRLQEASDIERVVIALKEKDFKSIKTLSGRYTNDYPTFIAKLYEELYKHAHPTSIPNVILTIGDNQKYWQQVANLEIHIAMMLCSLMIETNWK